MSVVFPYELWAFSNGNKSLFRSPLSQRAGAFDFQKSLIMIRSRLQFLGCGGLPNNQGYDTPFKGKLNEVGEAESTFVAGCSLDVEFA